MGGINIIFLFHLLNPEVVIEAAHGLNRLILVLCVLFYPIIDMLRVVIIRLKNKKSPFTADQNHIHHFFIGKGLSHINTTLLITAAGVVMLSFIIFL